MDAVDLRAMSYFVAVAEELHFGRAAERLGMAQPPLSRAIANLERRLGATLFLRSSRSVTLTPAGETFLQECRKALDAAEAAVRRTRRVVQSEARLPIAMKPGGDAGLLPPILAMYEADAAAVPIEVMVCGVGEQAVLLRRGRADVAFLHLPYDQTNGFETMPLLDEQQVAVLPRKHRLAQRAGVSMDELRGEPFPRWPGSIGGTEEGEIHDTAQLLQLIALGHLIAVLPESVTAQLWIDLVAVPVLDAPATSVVLAWPERSTSLAVAAFVRAAEAVAEQAMPLAGDGVGR